MKKLNTQWQFGGISSKSYTCGYCSTKIASDKGFPSNGGSISIIYVCHNCNRPTVFLSEDNKINQYPGPSYGEIVKEIPKKEIENLYNEARDCIKVKAYTASVLCSRKLIMNIAHSKGAKKGLTFAEYVDYLDSNNFTPPDSKDWVDHIRKKGNEATHEIEEMKETDANELIDFLHMLMKFIYEFPAIMKNKIST